MSDSPATPAPLASSTGPAAPVAPTPATASPAAPAAPVDDVSLGSEPEADYTPSEEIVANLFADRTPAPAAKDKTPATPAPAAVVPATPAEPLSEVEQLLHDAGYTTEKRPDGRNATIPRGRVKEMIETGLKKGQAKMQAEFDGVFQEAVRRETEVSQKLQRFSEEAANIERLMQDPDTFIREAAKHHPGYRKYLTPQSTNGGAPRSGAPISEGMPQPDVKLPDGSMTYSLEGLERRDAWRDQQLEERIAQRYAPIEQTVGEWQKTRQQREQEALIISHATKTISTMLDEAQTWPHFGKLDPSGSMNEVQSAVLKELQDNPNISLHQAYMKAVKPKLTADRNRMREEILAEINSRPSSTSAPAGTPAARTAAKTASSEDIVRQAFRNSRT